jgi:hypothetical protein
MTFPRARTASSFRARRRALSVSLAACGLALATPVVAEPWLSFRGSPHCSAAPDALAARISGAVAGARDRALNVTIEIQGRSPEMTALVRLARGAHEIGAKRIRAASCDEALDAALAVAALAVGTPSPPPPEPAAAEHEPVPPEREPAIPEGERLPSPPRDRAAVAPSRAGAPVRLPLLHGFWSAGIDHGALTALTPVLGLGVGARVGSGELRVRFAYGLPISSEENDTSTGLERQREDFAALAIEGCRGPDAAGWLSFCAGVEARATRSSELEAPADEPSSGREQLAAGVWALAGASLVYRKAAWQPRLDVSAQLPVVGGPAGADVIGARAAFGARLPF